MQWMYGCERHGNSTRSYDQYSYDGTDFLLLNMSPLNWTAATEKAELFKNMWDTAGDEAVRMKNYTENECLKTLDAYVSHLNLTKWKGKVQDLLCCPKQARIVTNDV